MARGFSNSPGPWPGPAQTRSNCPAESRGSGAERARTKTGTSVARASSSSGQTRRDAGWTLVCAAGFAAAGTWFDAAGLVQPSDSGAQSSSGWQGAVTATGLRANAPSRAAQGAREAGNGRSSRATVRRVRRWTCHIVVVRGRGGTAGRGMAAGSDASGLPGSAEGRGKRRNGRGDLTLARRDR